MNPLIQSIADSPDVAPAFRAGLVTFSTQWKLGHAAYPHFDCSNHDPNYSAGYCAAYHEHMDAKEAFEAQRPDVCDAWKKVRDRDLEES